MSHVVGCFVSCWGGVFNLKRALLYAPRVCVLQIIHVQSLLCLAGLLGRSESFYLKMIVLPVVCLCNGVTGAGHGREEGPFSAGAPEGCHQDRGPQRWRG